MPVLNAHKVWRALKDIFDYRLTPSNPIKLGASPLILRFNTGPLRDIVRA